MIQNIPVVTRDSNHQVTTVGNAKYDDKRGHVTLRLDIDTLSGNHFLLGKTIELGLVESFQLSVVASDFGLQEIEKLEEAVSEEENAVVEELAE